MLGAIIDALYFYLDILAQKYQEVIFNKWDNNYASFNNGQQSIFMWYMASVLGEYVDAAMDNWPWTDSSDYESYMWGSYHDMNVLDRAFSDSIYDPEEEMDEIAYHAQDIQLRIDILEAIDIF